MEKEKSKPITIRDIPTDLWKQVRAKAMLEGKTTRQAVIELFRGYIMEKGGK